MCSLEQLCSPFRFSMLLRTTSRPPPPPLQSSSPQASLMSMSHTRTIRGELLLPLDGSLANIRKSLVIMVLQGNRSSKNWFVFSFFFLDLFIFLIVCYGSNDSGCYAKMCSAISSTIYESGQIRMRKNCSRFGNCDQLQKLFFMIILGV